MLIDRYVVSLRICSACRAPSADDDASACAYCGSTDLKPQTLGVFSHDLRVLACGSCAGPVPVPRTGGDVACHYCQVRFSVEAKRDKPLSSTDMPEAQRLALLASQPRIVQLPMDMRPLLKLGGLVDETAKEATAMWQAARQLALREPSEKHQKRLFHLTELLADYHNWKERPLVARSHLEAATEIITEPRFLQPIYCWLARNAGAGGDAQASRDWLALCDARPQHLDMDSAVRYAWTILAVRDKDYATVIKALGPTGTEFPLAEKYGSVTKMYRAHALEMTKGPKVAAQVLASTVTPYPRTWRLLRTIIDAEKKFDMCPESFLLAAKMKFGWFVPYTTLVTSIAFILFLWVGRFFGEALWGESIPWAPTILLTIFIGGLGTLMGWAMVTRRSFALRLARKPREERDTRGRAQSTPSS